MFCLFPQTNKKVEIVQYPHRLEEDQCVCERRRQAGSEGWWGLFEELI